MTCLATQNICVTKGDTAPVEVYYKNPDGSAVDMTGYTAKFTAKDRVDDQSPIFQLTEVAGITIAATDGMLSVNMTPTQTSLLSWTGAHYDLEVTDAGGIVTTLVSGRIEVESEITT